MMREAFVIQLTNPNFQEPWRNLFPSNPSKERQIINVTLDNCSTEGGKKCLKGMRREALKRCSDCHNIPETFRHRLPLLLCTSFDRFLPRNKSEKSFRFHLLISASFQIIQSPNNAIAGSTMRDFSGKTNIFAFICLSRHNWSCVMPFGNCNSNRR